jgi:hypothetical protein
LIARARPIPEAAPVMTTTLSSVKLIKFLDALLDMP